MLTQTPTQRRALADAQRMRAYADKPRAITAAGADLSWLEEEVRTPSRPTAGRRKVHKAERFLGRKTVVKNVGDPICYAALRP
jgi:hypothetical protein